MPSNPVPAGGLLHPAPLLAIALLLVNDHVLKGSWPGFVTGKLSDLAGLVFFPLVLQAAVEVLLRAVGRPWGPSRRVLASAIAATALCFAAIQLWAPAGQAWSWGLGALQWPVHALRGGLVGRGLPDLLPTAHTPDPTDLMALPVLVLTWAVGSAGRRESTTGD